MLKTKVAVVGCGPIGMFSSLLLQHFNIDYVTFQKFDNLRSHPSAHWVSARSKQILSQIPNLTQKIDQNQESFQYFRNYRYCQNLLGFQFGYKDHFQSNIGNRLQKSKQIFGQYPNHISQAKLLRIMYDNLKQNKKIELNQNITYIQQHQNKDKNILYNQKKQIVCEADYVILANGVRSILRDKLTIHIKKLAHKIKTSNLPAMLHFIWNQKLPSILVNHSYQTGTFVLQIPNYQPFLDLTKIYTPRQLISTILDQQNWQDIQNDVNIIHIGKWKLQALIAQKFRSNNVFLVGDTAHTFTPAGGFGMNSGFQDAHQIIHFLHFIERNKQCNKQKLFDMYNNQRKQADLKYLKKSLQNYKLTQEISSKLGFPTNLTQKYINFSHSFPKILLNNLPQSKDQMLQKIRLKCMQFLYKRAKFEPQLQLFFDQFDHSVSKISSKAINIAQRTKKGLINDLYIDESVKIDQVQKIFGKIRQNNIQRFKVSTESKQRIIRRDGIYL